MGNYTLLGSVGGNIFLEFFYSGPHSLRSRMHTPIMGMERHLQAQIHDRLQSKAVAGMQPPLPGPCNQLL